LPLGPALFVIAASSRLSSRQKQFDSFQRKDVPERAMPLALSSLKTPKPNAKIFVFFFGFSLGRLQLQSHAKTMASQPKENKKRKEAKFLLEVSKGDETAVANLLAEHPNLIESCDARTGWTALHMAAYGGHDKVVLQLLAASPHLVNIVDRSRCSVMHYAAAEGHVNIVAIFATNPGLVDSFDCQGVTPLHRAASKGHDKVVALLLDASPGLIMQTDIFGATALHHAAVLGQNKIVTQLLVASPALIDAVNSDGFTALHSALFNKHEETAKILLAAKPDLVFVVNSQGDSLLHLAVRFECKELIVKLWQLYPQALYMTNHTSNTPFDVAVIHENDFAIELLQPTVTFDMAAGAFLRFNKGYMEQLKPIVERQTVCLAKLISRDVESTVFEYLGFEPVPNGAKTKVNEEPLFAFSKSKNTHTENRSWHAPARYKF